MNDLPRHDDPTEIEPRPTAPPLTRDATTAQLRRDIESGATGDKVRALDPAAAPLGTDDEAAGVRADPRVIGAERRRLHAPPPPPAGGMTGAWVVVFAIAVSAAAFLVVGLQ